MDAFAAQGERPDRQNVLLRLCARKWRGEDMKLTAAVIVNDASQARPILESLSRKGFAGIVESDPKAVLETCMVNPPDLVIVEDRLTGMTGIHFLAELLKVSWTTSTILIADEEEEAIHDRTEGLGILGAIRTADDVKSLDRLLDKFREIVSPNKSISSVEG
jgi:DNA-binding NarL/FixJ family response regulator